MPKPPRVALNKRKNGTSEDDTNPKKTKSAVPECWTVAITGLLEGDVIRGIAKSSGAAFTDNAFDSVRDVVLKVESGKQSANKTKLEICEKHHGEGFYRLAASQLAMRPIDLEMRLQGIPKSDAAKELIGLTGSQTNYSPLPIKFTIMNMGAWDSEQFQTWARDGTPLSGVQIIEELRNMRLSDHTKHVGELALRQCLWELAPPCLKVMDDSIKPDADATIYDSRKNNSSTTEMYKVERRQGDGYMVLKVPRSNSEPLSDDDIIEALEMEFKSQNAVKTCWNILSKWSPGRLKSAFQKFIRCASDTITMNDESGDYRIDMSVAAACAVSLCATRRGNQFIPELGQFVRGQTSAFKRVAVIMVEDAWPDTEDASELLEGALTIALCSARVADYHVPIQALVRLAMTAAMCAVSRTAIVFRDVNMFADQKLRMAVNPQKMCKASCLINIVRSLKGDLEMFDMVSKLAKRNKEGKVPIVTSNVRHETMPLHHIADQHAFRGIGHCFADGVSFLEIFKSLFGRVTGLNPRRQDRLIDESDPFTVMVRHAQKCVMANGKKDFPINIVFKESANIRLDPGILSGGVGPIDVKVKNDWYQVVLGIDGPDPIVFRKITRDTKGTDVKPVAPEIKHFADVAVSKKGRLPFSSPMLPHFSSAVYEDEKWILKSTTKEEKDVVWTYDNQIKVEYSVISADAASWTSDMKQALKNDALILDILETRAPAFACLMENGQTFVENLCAALNHSQHLRLLSLIRNQYSKIIMPVPSLSGGDLSSDQLMAMSGDWTVWRALVLLCALAPGVISPGAQPPTFNIKNAHMLKLIEGWIAKSVPVCEKGNAVCWQTALDELKALQTRTNKELKKHQNDTIRDMLSRDDDAVVKTPGHYVNMETGTGKTITGLRYAFEWSARNNGIDRIVWCVPKASILSHYQEFREIWKISCEIVDNKSSKAQFNSRVHVYLVESDHQLRSLKDKLPSIVGRSFFVFDEVHTLYNPALKTSVARMCARTCPKFLCMTATPLTGKSLVAIDWLADTCGFPVTRANELVAAARMFSAIVLLPIKRIETLIEMDITPQILDLHRKAAGTNDRWLEVALAVRKATANHMCDVAIERAVADRAKHPNVGGGVLLAANSSDEAQTYVNYINNKLSSRSGVDFFCGLFDVVENKRAGIVVVTMDQVLGYNSAVRLGVMVTGVYGSSSAKRHQLRGRLYRYPQVGVRESIEYVTVVMKGTILRVLHDRHSSADGKNMKIQEAGRLYASTVMY